MERKLSIPPIYRSFIKGSERPVDLYYDYAQAYFQKNYPEYEVLGFDKDKAICILKSDKN